MRSWSAFPLPSDWERSILSGDEEGAVDETSHVLGAILAPVLGICGCCDRGRELYLILACARYLSMSPLEFQEAVAELASRLVAVF